MSRPGTPRTRSLNRAVTVLRAVAARPATSASELARTSGLPRSTVARTLRTLADAGMVEEVSSGLQFTKMDGNIGIGHTRWATHGSVCKENAHPHSDCAGNIILAHNGVIENYSAIKGMLASKSHHFASDTDSEVIAHLIEENARKQPLLKAFIGSIAQLEGSYAIVAVASADKETPEDSKVDIAKAAKVLGIVGKDQAKLAKVLAGRPNTYEKGLSGLASELELDETNGKKLLAMLEKAKIFQA